MSARSYDSDPILLAALLPQEGRGWTAPNPEAAAGGGTASGGSLAGGHGVVAPEMLRVPKGRVLGSSPSPGEGQLCRSGESNPAFLSSSFPR